MLLLVGSFSSQPLNAILIEENYSTLPDPRLVLHRVLIVIHCALDAKHNHKKYR